MSPDPAGKGRVARNLRDQVEEATTIALVAALKPVAGLMDALPDGVAVISRDGAIVFANRQLVALTGYGREELLLRTVDDLVPDRQRARHRQHRADFAQRPTPRPMGADMHIDLSRKDGTELPVDISLSPLGDGSGSVVAAVRDARRRRSAELAMRRLSVMEDRERISRRLNGAVIHDVFALGLNLQALALLTDDDAVRRRLEDAVASTDRAIEALREVIFESTNPVQVAQP